MMKQYKQIALISLYFFAVANVFAATAIDLHKLYRYTNEKGQKVLSNQVPPDAVVRGYEVIDGHGKVKEIVAPSLTQEQREAKVINQQREANDKRIMNAYSDYEEIDQAYQAVMTDIDSTILVIENNLKNFVDLRATIQTNAANMERSGKEVPEETAKKLFNLDNKIKLEKKKLFEREEAKKAEMAKYTADRLRLGELRHLAGPSQKQETELRPLVAPSNP